MNNKVILILSIIVLITICFTFYNYINYLPTNTYIHANQSMKALYNKGSFDDVINMKFYTAAAIFLIVSTIPLTLIIATTKQIIKREPIN